MNELIGRKTRDSNGEEIIELDLNKPWPSRESNYISYSEDTECLSLAERQKKAKKEFITILN